MSPERDRESRRTTALSALRPPPALDAEMTRESIRGRALSALPAGPLRVEPVTINGALTGTVTGHAEVRATFAVEPSALLVAKLAYLEHGFADLKGTMRGQVGSTMGGSNAPAKSALYGGGAGVMHGPH